MKGASVYSVGSPGPGSSALPGPAAVAGDRVASQEQSWGLPLPSFCFSIQEVNFTGIHFTSVYGASGAEEGTSSMATCLQTFRPGRPPGGTQHSQDPWTGIKSHTSNPCDGDSARKGGLSQEIGWTH